MRFGDEAGWSLITQIGPLWAKQGTRPRVPVCGKRAQVSVVGFVEPQTGQWISYLVPALDSDWYSQVLALRAAHFSNEPIQLSVDPAGWHIGKAVVVPQTMDLEFLPPHSPELNPTEPVWEDVRYNHTRNVLFTESEVLWET